MFDEDIDGHRLAISVDGFIVFKLLELVEVNRGLICLTADARFLSDHMRDCCLTRRSLSNEFLHNIHRRNEIFFGQSRHLLFVFLRFFEWCADIFVGSHGFQPVSFVVHRLLQLALRK